MNYKTMNNNSCVKCVKVIILIFMIVIMIMFVIPAGVKAALSNTSEKRNMFYVEALNYAMPLAKVTAFDEDDMAENQFSIKERITDVLGINIKNPLGIVYREMGYVGSSAATEVARENKEPESEQFFFNPFSLSEGEISKNTSNQIQTPTPVQNPAQGTDLTNKVISLYDPKFKKSLNVNKPEVFIYHTHTSEGYTSGGIKGNSDEKDPARSVVAVGDVLAEELEKNYGIAVIHDKTVHDAVAYNSSYIRSASTIDKYLKKYGDFKLIIDLHRDSNENKNAMTIKINGVDTAKVMFTMAKNNPHFAKNNAVADKIQEISNKLTPGFWKSTFYYPNGRSYFNQGKSNNAVLLEVGSQVNTIDETKNSARYIARIIAEYINGKN